MMSTFETICVYSMRPGLHTPSRQMGGNMDGCGDGDRLARETVDGVRIVRGQGECEPRALEHHGEVLHLPAPHAPRSFKMDGRTGLCDLTHPTLEYTTTRNQDLRAAKSTQVLLPHIAQRQARRR